MKLVKALVIWTAILFFLFLKTSAQPNAALQASVQNETDSGFAVLELFTSEGCSSCPPADELLERIQKEVANRPIYVLSFHVDYWNNAGWKDVFSKASFSERQYAYNRWFTSQVYTPQLIINGKSEYVGSNEPAIRNSLAKKLNKKPSAYLKISAHRQLNNMQINYETDGNIANDKLMIAVIQKQAASNVKRGENAGRTLLHTQIVQNLFVLNVKQKGYAKIGIAKEFNSNDWEIIGMVQDMGTGEIKAANHVDIIP